MKSAEEWAAEYANAGASEKPRLFCEVLGCDCAMNECKEIADYVRAIQRDALKAAMDKCSAVYEDWDEANNGGDHQAAAGVDAAHACIRDIADIFPQEPSA
jgi:predicted naringenin-chalcone synthase